MTGAHGTGHDHGHGSGHDDLHAPRPDPAHGAGHDEGHGAGHGIADGKKHAVRQGTRHSPRHTAQPSEPAAASGASLAGWMRGIAAVITLAIVLLPFYPVIAQVALFETASQDEYAKFLLGLLGLPGGEIPGAPVGYRALSVLAAAPFYYVLPPLPLISAPAALSADFIQATAALAFLSYLALAATLFATYRLARDRTGQDAGTALFAAALLFVLCWYSQVSALDPLAILLITLGLYLLRSPQGFALLLLAAPILNEKIAIVFALWLTIRCATSSADRAAFGLQWATAMMAMLLYAMLIAFGHLPPIGVHLEPGTFMATLRSNLANETTSHGLMLDVLPALLLLCLALIGHFGGRRRDLPPLRWHGLFRPVDLLMVPAMAGVALAVEVVLAEPYQIGRFLMHAAPLFVVPAASVLVRRIASPAAAESRAS